MLTTLIDLILLDYPWLIEIEEEGVQYHRLNLLDMFPILEYNCLYKVTIKNK